MKKTIYLDNAATTPVDKEVLLSMMPYFSEKYGNASEPHFWGQEARKAVETSRHQVAQVLGAIDEEIIFTCCATESINLAHKGLIENQKSKIKNQKLAHLITSSVEHKAVLEVCKHLEKLGWVEVTYLPVDECGLVQVEDLQQAIKPETVLVSIMYVNNEVGTIQPIEEIGQVVAAVNKNREQKIYFHTDATQAIQYLDCNVNRLGVDLLSLTGHKLSAPKGVGALFVRQGTGLVKQQDGGGQEGNLRAGTENVPYLVGLAKAIELNSINKEKKLKRIANLRDRLIAGILKIPGTKLTGHPEKRVPHIASFTVEGAEGEAMLLLLSEEGIAASSGSACTSGGLQPSHVLTAMGIPPQIAHGSIRFSLGKETTEDDVNSAIKILPKIINQLRIMAPKGI